MTLTIVSFREKECDIRIKLTSISRLHARIVIDENGDVSIYASHIFFVLTCD